MCLSLISIIVTETGLYDSQYTCRLGIASKAHYGIHMVCLQNDNVEILYPGEYVENPERAYEFVRKHNLKHTYDGDMNLILKIILRLFKDITDDDIITVSRTCDIGIHT